MTRTGENRRGLSLFVNPLLDFPKTLKSERERGAIRSCLFVPACKDFYANVHGNPEGDVRFGKNPARCLGAVDGGSGVPEGKSGDTTP